MFLINISPSRDSTTLLLVRLNLFIVISPSTDITEASSFISEIIASESMTLRSSTLTLLIETSPSSDLTVNLLILDKHISPSMVYTLALILKLFLIEMSPSVELTLRVPI